MKGFSKVVLGSLVVLFSLSTVAVAASDSTSLQNTQPTQQYAPIDGIVVKAPRGVQTYYPDQTSASADPLNTNPAYLDSLPSCPGDPSNVKAPKAPSCPDVNNKWTSNFKDDGILLYQGGNAYNANGTPTTTLSKFCPDICTSTRYISFTTAVATTGTTYNRVSEFKPAICPPGYSQVAAIKSDFDVAYNSGSIGLIVTSDAQRIAYLNQGATCNAQAGGTKYIAAAYCSYSTNTTVKSATNNCVVSSTDAGYGNLTSIDGTKIYGKWTSCVTTTDAQNTFGCFYPGDSTCTLKSIDGKNATACAASPSGYSTKYSGNLFSKVVCIVPPGYYLTTNTVPTKVVCSRVKTVWQMQQ